MNIQNLNPGKYANFDSNLRDRLGNAYEHIASGSDYKKNTRDLRIIQAAVVTVVMVHNTSFLYRFAQREIPQAVDSLCLGYDYCLIVSEEE